MTQTPKLLKETRQHDDRSAAQQVQLAASANPAEHVVFAGAVSWHSLAKSFLNEGQGAAAWTCAERGLEELGDRYETHLVDDDTELKIYAAEETRKAGRTNDAADILIRALETRIHIYRVRFKQAFE